MKITTKGRYGLTITLELAKELVMAQFLFVVSPKIKIYRNII